MTGLGNIDDVYKHYLVVIEENQQLKVLLRECRESVLFEAKVVKETSGKDSTAYKILTRILTKIDNAIGEKK
jgi:hypothetical protein